MSWEIMRLVIIIKHHIIINIKV